MSRADLQLVLSGGDGQNCLQVSGFLVDMGGVRADVWAQQAESLWDEALPVEVRELPADLAELDRGVGRSGADDGAAGALAPRGVETGRAV